MEGQQWACSAVQELRGTAAAIGAQRGRCRPGAPCDGTAPSSRWAVGPIPGQESLHGAPLPGQGVAASQLPWRGRVGR